MTTLLSIRANKEQTLRLCTSLSSTGSARNGKGYHYYSTIILFYHCCRLQKKKVVTESDYEDVIPVPPTGFNHDSICLGSTVYLVGTYKEKEM